MDQYNTSHDHWLIVSDFDETFMPTKDDRRSQAGVDRLQRYLEQQRPNLKLYFGWATGNNVSAVLKILDDFPGFPWTFLLSGLGTELYWNRHNDDSTSNLVHEDKAWPETSIDLFGQQLARLLGELEQLGLELSLQPEKFQQKRVRGYYLQSDTAADDIYIQQLQTLAQRHQLKAEVTRANPAAGDPEGVYDVAFLPTECGKLEGLIHLASRLAVPDSNIICFGDSCNDLSMLNYSRHAYLVENADPQAKALFPHVINGHYCNGILNGLRKHLTPVHCLNP